MEQQASPDGHANNQSKPTELPSPKRGAFPTPKSEIEKATPYRVDADDEQQNTPSPQVGAEEDQVPKRP